MIKKLLVANRGEIAYRIIRACRELQIKTVAIYSSVDKDEIHVKYADEAVCIGGPRSSESYLKMETIIFIAKQKGCDAIHPGYGFLSENSKFAKMVEDEGLIFVGPKSTTIAQMGDKVSARRLMKSVGVNIVPGIDKVVTDPVIAESYAEEIGYPVLIKASGGGGGKGMRRVYKSEDFRKNFEAAQSEANSAFSNKDMYIEKLIENQRHIEVQILADRYGNVISLYERNCSIQRNNQKLIEEAPVYNFEEKLRKDINNQAIIAAKACNYENAGTVEFVLDKDNNFYFIEMNTRLQVEHPVTEMITGVDIVQEQLKIASGLELSYRQKDIKILGYAIECRINAEDPFNNFSPQCGKVDYLYPPGGFNTRFDSHLYTGSTISPYYDSMIGKIIVFDRTRLGAIRKLRRSIEETVINGIKTNLYLAYTISFDKDFLRAKYTTSFINEKLDTLLGLMERYR